LNCARWAVIVFCALFLIGCSSVDIQPFESESEASAPSAADPDEHAPAPLTVVVQGVGFGEHEGAGITVRFVGAGVERDAVVEAGRFSVDFSVIPPDELPPSALIDYVLHGRLRELCEERGTPVLRANAPVTRFDGFATVVVNHAEVPPEPIDCEMDDP